MDYSFKETSSDLSDFTLLYLPLPSAKCRVWVEVWPEAPSLLSSGCGGVREPASALSTPAAERQGPLCHEPVEWPEDRNTEK
jgi:hypothetical protein